MKPVTLDDFTNFTYLSHMRFSPNGENLCFVLSRADLKANCYHSYIYRLAGDTPIQLTSGGKEDSFFFLDDTTILFPGDRDGSSEPSIATKYYRISLLGGEAVKAYTFPIPVSKLMPLSDGNFLLCGSVFPGYEKLYTGDARLLKKYLEDQKENEDYEVVEENPWWYNGGTFTRGAYTTLFFYDTKKKKLHPLTDTEHTIMDVQLSPNQKDVFFWSKKRAVVNDFYTMDLVKLSLEDHSMITIFSSTADRIGYGYELGKTFGLLMISDSSHMGGNSNPDFYRFDYETYAITPYATYGQSIGTSVGTDIRRGGGFSAKMVDDILYFTSTLYDSCYLMKLENGIISKVIDREGSVDGFDITPDGSRIVLSALWNMKGIELYNKYINKEETPLTHFNDTVLKGKYVAQPVRCDAINDDHDIHGFVLPPMGYDPASTQEYPVIFDIHGGPKTVYGPVFYHEMQYWASKGYFVIFCNPTGSDGRGDAFADITGKYGTVDYDDLMCFLDQALATWPAMDPDRLYETGGSYGGFMTNWIVGHTDRFRACATQRSIVNWFSFFGVSDIGLGFTPDQNHATPWQNPEALWDRSPMKYLDKCKTPTLIIHSMEDYRCPVDQGYQMYSSLVANGVESRMVLFKGENHDLSRSGKPKHRIRRLKEITGWFECH